jgi:hypothetical protein
MMSGIGPELPPHLLAKRKRQADEDASPAPTVKADSPARSPYAAEKRRRVIGPAAPPAALDEMPSKPAESEENSDSSDDDFGPSLPTGDAPTVCLFRQHRVSSANIIQTIYDVEQELESRSRPGPRDKPAIKRDDWMMMPPTADGLAKNMDPSKRPSKFRSGKGPTPGGGGLDSTWTETPEEKRKRLQNQVLGIAPPPSSKNASESVKSKHDEDAARRIKEYNVSRRHLFLSRYARLTRTRRSTEANRYMTNTKVIRIGSQMMTQASERLIARKT